MRIDLASTRREVGGNPPRTGAGLAVGAWTGSSRWGATSPVTGGQVVARQQTQDGGRYVFEASDAEGRPIQPDPDRFDCTGLVAWVCRRLGVRPNVRTTSAMGAMETLHPCNPRLRPPAGRPPAFVGDPRRGPSAAGSRTSPSPRRRRTTIEAHLASTRTPAWSTGLARRWPDPVQLFCWTDPWSLLGGWSRPCPPSHQPHRAETLFMAG